MTKFEKHQLAEEIRTLAIGVPACQLAKRPTLSQRRAFIKAYDKCKSQSAQDALHENQFA